MDEDDHERTQIRSELTTMSFEQLIKLKEELGTKVYNEAIFGDKSTTKNSEREYKRANKNRPREMSAKRPVPFLAIAERAQSSETQSVRDPRFDEKCGEFNKNTFKTNYEFVNDIRVKEIDQLKGKLKKLSDNESKQQIKLVVQRLENQTREEQKRKIREDVLKTEHEEKRKAKEEGKQPWHISKKERKLTELVKQYEDYKKSGKLGKHLEKRRKKNATKDRKKLNLE